EEVQAEGHRPRPPRRQDGAAVPRRRQGVRPGGAQPRARPAEEGAGAGAEACAFRQGARREADRACGYDGEGSQDQGACRPVPEAWLVERPDHRRGDGGRGFRARGPQHSRYRRAAGAGDQRLRHPAPRYAGPYQGRGRGAHGAVQMIALTHYDVIRRPVITERSTAVSEHNKVIFQVAPTATKEQIKAAVEALFKVKVKSVNTLIRKG